MSGIEDINNLIDREITLVVKPCTVRMGMCFVPVLTARHQSRIGDRNVVILIDISTR